MALLRNLVYQLLSAVLNAMDEINGVKILCRSVGRSESNEVKHENEASRDGT